MSDPAGQSNRVGLPNDVSGYCTPSLMADALATVLGLALVYGMIALIGNNGPANAANSPPQMVSSALHGKAVATLDTASNTVAASQSLPTQAGLAGHAKGEMKAFLVHPAPRVLPDFAFFDEQGKERSIKEWRGKVVLVNLWATWCGPCRHEMPDLDSLKRKFKDRSFELLAISLDRSGVKKPRRFFDKIGVKSLAVYNNNSGRLGPDLGVVGMPTSLLLDRQGRELGRLTGPAKWAGSDAIQLIEAAIGAATGKS